MEETWRRPPSRSGSSGSGPSASALKSALVRRCPLSSATARRAKRCCAPPRDAVGAARDAGRAVPGGRVSVDRLHDGPELPRAHRAPPRRGLASSSPAATPRSPSSASTWPSRRATARRSTSSRSAARPSTTPSGRAARRTRSTSSRSPSTAVEGRSPHEHRSRDQPHRPAAGDDGRRHRRRARAGAGTTSFSTALASATATGTAAALARDAARPRRPPHATHVVERCPRARRTPPRSPPPRRPTGSTRRCSPA